MNESQKRQDEHERRLAALEQKYSLEVRRLSLAGADWGVSAERADEILSGRENTAQDAL